MRFLFVSRLTSHFIVPIFVSEFFVFCVFQCFTYNFNFNINTLVVRNTRWYSVLTSLLYPVTLAFHYTGVYRLLLFVDFLLSHALVQASRRLQRPRNTSAVNTFRAGKHLSRIEESAITECAGSRWVDNCAQRIMLEFRPSVWSEIARRIDDVFAYWQ